MKNPVVIALALAVVACVLFWPDAEESQPAAPKTLATPSYQKSAPYAQPTPERFNHRANPNTYYQDEVYGGGFRPPNGKPMLHEEQHRFSYGQQQNPSSVRSPAYGNYSQRQQDSRAQYANPEPMFGQQALDYSGPGSTYGGTSAPYGNRYGYAARPTYKFRPLNGETKEKATQSGRYQSHPHARPYYEEPSLTPNAPSYGNPSVEPWEIPNYPGTNFEFPQTSNRPLFSVR